MKLGEGTTPGPWEIQTLPHYDYSFRKGNSYALRDRRNCCLATVGEVDAIFDGTESESNARLIAKAPLLIECRDVLDRIETTIYHLNGDESLPSYANDIVQEIRALLAKLEA